MSAVVLALSMHFFKAALSAAEAVPHRARSTALATRDVRIMVDFPGRE
jgi:hypothetical protein